MGILNILRTVSIDVALPTLSCIKLPQVVSGMVIGIYKPTSPPVVPTPENYLEGIVATKSTVLLCVPSFVEVRLSREQLIGNSWILIAQAWFRNPDNLPALRSLSAIVSLLTSSFCDDLPRSRCRRFMLAHQ